MTENEAVGKQVGKVSANDDTKAYTFILPSGLNNNDLFLIDGKKLVSAAVFDYEEKAEYLITIQAIDELNQITSEDFSIQIINQGPTDLSLSKSSVDENLPPMTKVGKFSSEGGKGFTTYTLVSGPGDTNNDLFTINDKDLEANISFDYEIQTTYSIRVQATDKDNESFTTAFSILVNNLSEGPTDITITNNKISENEPAGTVVGTIVAEGGAPPYTYQLGSGMDNASYTINGDQLLTNAVFDFEQKATLSIRIAATDVNNEVFEKTFEIEVTDKGPTDILLSDKEIEENLPAGTLVGELSTEGGTSPYSYTFVQGTNYNYQLFNLAASSLTTAQPFDYENKPSYLIKINSEDAQGEKFSKEFTINVIDVVEVAAPVVANPISDFSVQEDASNSTFDLNTVFSDADGDALTYTVVNDNSTLLSASVEGATLTLDYLPNQFGQATITLTASDGTASVQDVFIVTVNPVNDKPVTAGIANVNVGENAPQFLIDLSVAFADVEDAILVYEIVGNTNGVLVVPQINNTVLALNFTPNKNGTSQITIKATDTGGESVQASFQVSVADVNNPPTFIITNPTVTSKEDAGKQQVSGFASEIKDGDDGSQQLKFNLTQTAFSGLIAFANAPSIDATTGELTYTAQANAFGTADYAVTLSDNGPTGGSNNNTSAAQSFKIVIQPVGDPPVVPTGVKVDVDETASGLLVSRNPVDREEVTHYKITNILGGNLFLADGTSKIENNTFITAAQGTAGLKFKPEGAFIEEGSFDATAATEPTDAGLGGTSTATLQIGIIPLKPVVTHAQTMEDTQTTSGLVLERNKLDDNNFAYFRISNITGGQLFQNDGTTPISNESYIEYDQGKAGLKFTPTPNATTNGSFTVQAAPFTFAWLLSDTANVIINIIPVNDAPVVAVPPAATVNEETALALSGFSVADVDLGTASIYVKLSVANGTLTLTQTSGITIYEGGNATAAMGISGSLANVNNALNSLKYVGKPGFSGPETVYVSVSDNGATGDGGPQVVNTTISINVLPVNDAPVLGNIEAGPLAFYEDSPPVSVTQSITLGDSDSETMASASVRISGGYQSAEDRLSFPVAHPNILGTFNPATGEMLLSQKSGGTDFSKAVFEDALRQVQYQNINTLVPNTTTRTVTFSVTDNVGAPSAPVSRNISVISVNDPPVLSGIETDPLLFVANTIPKVTQTITVGDVDGGNIASASVKIAQQYKQGEDVLDYLQVANITGKFFPDRGELVLEGVNTPGTYVAALRNVSYRNFAAFPTPGNRLVIFSVKDTDTNKSNELNRFIIIGDNDYPPTIFDIAKNGIEDTNIPFNLDNFKSAYLDDEGPDAVPKEIRIKSIPNNGKLFLKGKEITASAAAGDGFQVKASQIIDLVFTPFPNVNGKDNFTWNAYDGNSYAANDARVNIVIDPVNDKPTIAAPATLEVKEDIITKLNEISIDDIDAGNGLITVELSVDNGFLSLTQVSGLTFKEGDGSSDKKMEFDGNISSAKVAINSLTYLSALNFTGSDKLKITVDDNGNTGAGNIEINSVAVTIKVNPVNDPPFLSDIETEALTYPENNAPLPVTSSLKLDDVDDPDDAVAQATITISDGYVNAGEELLSFTPSAGITGEQVENVLTLKGTASLAAYLTVLKTVTYENKSDNPGNATRGIIFQLTDNQEAVSNAVGRKINVVPVNDAPALSEMEAADLPYYDGQTAAVITSTVEVNDPDNETLTQAIVRITENYQTGSDSLSFAGFENITGQWDRISGILTLNGAAAKEKYQEALRKVLYHKRLSENNDPRQISFSVSDGSESSKPVIRTVKILPNEPPSVAGFEKIANEDEPLIFTLEDFSEHYEDDNVPAENLSFIQILTLPVNGKLFFRNIELTGENLDTTHVTAETVEQLVYLSNPDFFGRDSLSWTASDGIKTANPGAEIQLTINPVNDAPLAGSFVKVGEEDSLVQFTANDFKNNYKDAEDDSLEKIVIRTLPQQGKLKLAGFEVALGTEISLDNIENLLYLPALNYNGEDSIRWSAGDTLSVSSETGLISLLLAPVNDAPVLQSFTKTSNENAVIAFMPDDFTSHFSDIENDELQKVIITRLPLHGILTLNEVPVVQNDTIARLVLASLKYTPNPEVVNGTDNFGWTASDAGLFAKIPANVKIIIGTGVTNFEVMTPEDSSFTFNASEFADNYNNPGGELTVVRIDLLPKHGTLQLNEANVAEGQEITKNDINSLVYVPDANFNGPDSLFWNASSGGDFAPINASIKITVLPVNDAPTISEISDQLILANQTLGPLSITLADVDSDPENLLLTAYSNNTNLVPFNANHLSLTSQQALQYNLTVTPLPDSSGTATITLLASDGEAETKVTFVLEVVIDILTVDAGDDLTIKEGGSAQLTATTTGGDAPFNFTWTCDQTDCAIADNLQPTVTVSPTQTTTYFVEVSEAKGLVSYDTVIVNVTPRPTALTIPSGFTPDGKEPNNFWIIDDLEFFDNVVVEVYNRYGVNVFRSEGYKQPWDGNYKGEILPVGTYYYVVNIENGSQVYKGTVVILR